jgi:predicted Zn-dependent peptidase
VLADAIFGDHPLGRPVIGKAEVISSIPVPDIADYHAARYSPENVVVAAAGSVEHERVVALVERALEGRASNGGPPAPQPAPARVEPRLCFHEKDTEQYHLCLGAPGLPRADERRFALRVLDAILGGSTSSRLFQEVREKRGLAYAVYSYSSHYLDSGHVGIYVGTRPDNVTEAMDVIGNELRRLATDGVLAMESTLARMNRLGSNLLTGVPLLSLDELLAATDAVALEDVQALASELFDPRRMSAAGVGASAGAFRSALEPVNPALAAA